VIITRFHNQAKLEFKVEFLTPTFLGGADQNAELRSAPFKNLLRQWWRVAKGSQYGDLKEMREKEGKLFGSVNGEKTSASSLRLVIHSGPGQCPVSKSSFNFGSSIHKEVNKGQKISNALYLGYGPITYKKELKQYIAPGGEATFSISCPKGKENEILLTLQYIHAFGTIGSRSRNGWGSLELSGETFAPQELSDFAVKPAQDLIEGKAQYPSSLAVSDDGRLLLWETKPQKEWMEVMRLLAETYMEVRTNINIKPQGMQKRHILGYPITNHSIAEWNNNNDRMPSQLRLMVKKKGNEFVGRILHLPHKLPLPWNAGRIGTEIEVWQEVHGLLDRDKNLHRSGGKLR